MSGNVTQDDDTLDGGYNSLDNCHENNTDRNVRLGSFDALIIADQILVANGCGTWQECQAAHDAQARQEEEDKEEVEEVGEMGGDREEGGNAVVTGWAGRGTTINKHDNSGRCRGFVFLSFHSTEEASVTIKHINNGNNNKDNGGGTPRPKLRAEMSAALSKERRKKSSKDNGNVLPGGYLEQFLVLVGGNWHMQGVEMSCK